MGNCLRHDNGLARKEKEDQPPMKLLEECKEVSRGLEEEESESRSKVVRVKVVVTKEELRQILEHKKEGINSIQHLVHVLRDSGRSILSQDIEEEEEQVQENWRPSLESIPENH